MSHNVSVVTLIAAAFVSGCASLPESDVSAPDAYQATPLFNHKKLFSKAYEEAYMRESVVTKQSAIKIDGLGIEVDIRGGAKIYDLDEAATYIEIDLGSEYPAFCYVSTEFSGPANGVNVAVQSVFDSINESELGPVDNVVNSAVGVGEISGSPYLLLDRMYLVEANGRKIVGMVKGLASMVGDALSVCVHDEFGYRHSHFQVFESLVTSLQLKTSGSTFYENVAKSSFNNRPVGFVQETYGADSEGDIQDVTLTSMLLLTEQSVSSIDNYKSNWSSPDGSLISAYAYNTKDNVPDYEYQLFIEEGAWRVKGEKEGEYIESELDHDGWMLSGYGMFGEIRDLFESDDNERVFKQWQPSVKPTEVSDTVLRKVGEPDGNSLLISEGRIEFEAVVDKHGAVEAADTKMGDFEFKALRIYSRGVPVAP